MGMWGRPGTRLCGCIDVYPAQPVQIDAAGLSEEVHE